MSKETLQYNGATITVETETGGMRLDYLLAQQTLNLREEKSQRRVMRALQFLSAWAQSTIEGDLGFPWPDNPVGEGMEAAFENWQTLIPPDDIQKWIEAVNRVNYTPNDTDLKPPEQMEKKGSKTPKSSKNDG